MEYFYRLESLKMTFLHCYIHTNTANMLYTNSNLNQRQEQIDKYRLKEALKVTTEYNSTNTDITYKNVYKILKITSINELRSEVFKEEYRNKEQKRLNSRGKPGSGGIKHSNEEEGLDSITNGSDR